MELCIQTRIQLAEGICLEVFYLNCDFFCCLVRFAGSRLLKVYSFVTLLCYADSGLQLAKTREHLSARVLSATTKEDQAEKDATIKLVTDEIKQGNQGSEVTLEKADATGENVNGEDAIDVDDNDGKLAKLSHDSTQEPLVKVGDIFSSWFVCCFSVQFVSFSAALSWKS